MATMNQDQKLPGTMVFFDSSTPPRPAKIDVSDRLPVITSPDPTIVTVSDIAVSADGMTLTYFAVSGLVGSIAGLSVDVDVNLASGQDTSLVVPTESIDVTPGPAGQAASGQSSFGAPVPKNP